MSDVSELIRVAQVVSQWLEEGEDRGEPFPSERVDLEKVKSSHELHHLAAVINSLLEKLEDSLEEHRDNEVQLEALTSNLKKSNKELEEFASVAAHDIRSPLSRINMAAKLLYDDISPSLSEQQRALFEIILRGVQSSNDQITSIYRWSKISRSKPQLTSIDLNTVVAEIVEISLPQDIEQAGGKIEVPSKLPSVLGDKSQVHLVLQNLIQNALRYRSPDRDPVIVISADEPKAGMIRVSVKDNGLGIAQEDIKRVFGNFSRVTVLNQQSRGLGIGLAHCRRIIKRLNGSMGVKSEYGKRVCILVYPTGN